MAYLVLGLVFFTTGAFGVRVMNGKGSESGIASVVCSVLFWLPIGLLALVLYLLGYLEEAE